MMDSFHMPVSHSAAMTSTTVPDPELEKKVKKASEKISENLHIFANEPSLACYRLQEHIHKSLPQLVLKRIEVNQMHRELQGKCYDLEYSINAIKSMQNSHDHFLKTQQLILLAIAAKQKLNSVEAKKADKKKTSMYQRFSGSFDLPSSILPVVATGLSSSASVSADLKSTPSSQVSVRPSSATATPRRSRASSVSSMPSRAALTRQHSASCSPTKKERS